MDKGRRPSWEEAIDEAIRLYKEDLDRLREYDRGGVEASSSYPSTRPRDSPRSHS